MGLQFSTLRVLLVGLLLVSATGNVWRDGLFQRTFDQGVFEISTAHTLKAPTEGLASKTDKRDARQLSWSPADHMGRSNSTPERLAEMRALRRGRRLKRKMLKRMKHKKSAKFRRRRVPLRRGLRQRNMMRAKGYRHRMTGRRRYRDRVAESMPRSTPDADISSLLLPWIQVLLPEGEQSDLPEKVLEKGTTCVGLPSRGDRTYLWDLQRRMSPDPVGNRTTRSSKSLPFQRRRGFGKSVSDSETSGCGCMLPDGTAEHFEEPKQRLHPGGRFPESSPQTSYAKLWIWVGTQLGKAFRSNDSGDGPGAGAREDGPPVHETDRQCLLIFHEAAQGALWPERMRWNLSDNPEYWLGVTLDEDGRVVSLALEFTEEEAYELQLRAESLGYIPPELGNLERLASLCLIGMGLGGTIPKELGWLKSLEQVELRRNRLVGEIPRELGYLSHIYCLDLSYNRLEGVIPTELGRLESVAYLDLCNNRLEGTIPAEVGTMMELAHIDLSDNRLEGKIPNMVASLPQLKRVDLRNNRLQGSIPSALGRKSCLGHLDLSNNELEGVIPTMLGKKGALTYLDLSNNNLEGNVLYELEHLGWLEQLNLSNNQFRGMIPPGLGTLGKLKFLDLSNNQLQGNIPRELGMLGKLERLNLGNNYLCGDLPAEMGDMVSLEIVDVKNNQLQGIIPPEIEKLEELRKVDMSNNQLQGDLPPGIGNLAKMEHFDLSNNCLRGVIPPGIEMLVMVEYLDLESNQLAGMIPPGIGMLQRLNYLNLSCNQLQGVIPADIGKLGSLNHLYLNGNRLEGSIPIEINELRWLVNMNLSHNQLQGFLPPDLDKLSWLRTLLLSNNRLEGYIPWEVGSLDVLQVLDLSRNQLQGGLPANLKSLDHLLHMDLSFNQLTGAMPERMGEMKLLGTMDLSHNQLEGCIPVTFASLVSVITMDLSHNRLEGAIPWGLANLHHLEYLDLGFNHLRGIIPPVLGTLAVLKKLSLRDNHLEGDIPIVLGTLDRLQRLDLSNNRLQGEIPLMFERLRELEYMYLTNNQLEGEIPSELGKLECIQRLDLSKNQLEGTIPLEIATQKSLKGINMSHNRLGGTIPPELGDLEDLDFLDLSHNQLEGSIPQELGMSGSLKTIDLSNNSLKDIVPSGLASSREMQKINLSYNRLRGKIPPELGTILHLKWLDLSSNRLQGSIPPELGDLNWLQIMDLSGNQLQGKIPTELATIYHLIRLDLSNNLLEGTIPRELGTLKWLESVDVSNNQLHGLWDHTKDVDAKDEQETEDHIPRGLAEWLAALARIKILKLVPNPFRNPPEAVAKRGMNNVERYYKNLFAAGFIIERRDVKVVIVGKPGAGKTSLRQSIREKKPCPTSSPSESTVNLEIDRVEIDGTEVSLYDCAGQEQYYGLLQLFITRRALCLVVCETNEFGIREFGVTDEQQLALDVRRLEVLGVCRWLRFLSWRLPECNVVLVGSKCDLLPPGQAKDMARRMENACETWLAAWGESSRTIRLEPGVNMTSCAAPTGFAATMKDMMDSMDVRQLWRRRAWPCDWAEAEGEGITTPGLLERITLEEGGERSRGAEMVIPHGWFMALAMLEALGESRNPLEWIRHRLHQRRDLVYEQVEEDGEGPGIDEHGVITLEDLERMWLEVVEALKSAHGIEVHDPLNALEGALSIRGYEGYVLRYGKFVFPDVRWLNAVLKPILFHHETNVCGEISLGKVCGKDIVLSAPEDQASWERLKTEGILEPNLARALWPDGLSEYVVPIMQNIDLAFALSGGEEGNLAVMIRLPKDRPTSAQKGLGEFQSSRYPSMRVSWKMPVGVPPGAIENLMVRCCHLGTTSAFRRYSVLVKGDVDDDDPGGEFALLLEYSVGGGELEFEIYGNVASIGPWTALCHALYSTLAVIHEFPGLPWKASLLCPSHGAISLQVSHKSRKPGDDLIAQGCNICNSQRGLGALAEELLREVDITQPQDVMLQRVKDKFTNMREAYKLPSLKGCRHSEGEQREALLQLVEDVQTALDDLGQHADQLEDVRQQLETTGTASQLQNFQQRKLLEMIEAMRTQGDETQAAVDTLGTLMNSVRGDQRSTPSLACMLPPWDFELKEGGLTCEEQDPATWMTRLGKLNFKVKGWFTSQTRLFLVCSRTYRLVPCGPKGQGYEITGTRMWAKRAAGAATLVLEMTSGTLSEVLKSQVPSSMVGFGTGVIADMVRDGVVLEIKSQLESAVAVEDQGCSGEPFDSDSQLSVSELRGSAYQKLKEFLYEVEDKGRGERMLAIKKARKNGLEIPSNSFVFFEDVMEQLPTADGSCDLLWALKGREDAEAQDDSIPALTRHEMLVKSSQPHVSDLMG